MLPFIMLAFLFTPIRLVPPILAVIDPVMGGAAVGVVVLVLILLYVNRSSLGMGSSTASADPLVSTLIKVLQKVDAAVMLSPLGRMAVCGIAIFLGKVTGLLPDDNMNKKDCLLACKKISDTFGDPTIAPPVQQPTPATATKVQ